MRALWLAALVMTLLTASASAQEVTIEDLVGTTIKSTVVRNQTGRLHNGKTYSGQTRSDLVIVISGKDDPIRVTYTSTWRGRNGRERTLVRRGEGRLGKPKENPRSGGGQGVGFLMNSTLYYIRTFKSGGFKNEFKLAHAPKGLSCTARETFLKEKGAGAIRLHSTHYKLPITIISDKQISSTCQVIKR